MKEEDLPRLPLYLSASSLVDTGLHAVQWQNKAHITYAKFESPACGSGEERMKTGFSVAFGTFAILREPTPNNKLIHFRFL